MWNISEMTARTGVPGRLSRYYEQQDLITPARDDNGCRVYCELGVERVTQIRSLLSAGLPARLIRQLLPRLSGADVTVLSGGSRDVQAVLRREAAALQRRIDGLATRRAVLLRYAAEIA